MGFWEFVRGGKSLIGLANATDKNHTPFPVSPWTFHVEGRVQEIPRGRGSQYRIITKITPERDHEKGRPERKIDHPLNTRPTRQQVELRMKQVYEDAVNELRKKFHDFNPKHAHPDFKFS